MYEGHISQTVSTDMHNLITSITRSDEIYEDILNKKKLTRRNAQVLHADSYDILAIPQDYNSLAVEFARMDNKEFKNKTADAAAEIGHFFYKMNKDVELDEQNLDEEVCEFNDEKEDIINLLKELNSLWLESVLKNVVGVSSHNGELEYDRQKFQAHYGDNSVTNDFWIDLIVDIDKNTRNFLSDHKLQKVEDIFNE